MFGRKKTHTEAHANGTSLHCSFCNKPEKSVRRLIAGPNVYICDECVGTCLQILNHEPKREVSTNDSASVATACSLCKVGMRLSDALVLPGRGVLCPECASAVAEAAPPPSQRPN